jgi:hypothetical protein
MRIRRKWRDQMRGNGAEISGTVFFPFQGQNTGSNPVGDEPTVGVYTDLASMDPSLPSHSNRYAFPSGAPSSTRSVRSLRHCWTWRRTSASIAFRFSFERSILVAVMLRSSSLRFSCRVFRAARMDGRLSPVAIASV